MAMPHANPQIHYHSNTFLLLLLLMSSDSSLYATKIREGVLGLTTGSTKDLTSVDLSIEPSSGMSGEWNGELGAEA